jgi:hypothetical protein
LIRGDEAQRIASNIACRSCRLGRTGFDAMSKLYSVLLLIASLIAMVGLGMAILVAITEIDHLIAPTNNPYGMNR